MRARATIGACPLASSSAASESSRASPPCSAIRRRAWSRSPVPGGVGKTRLALAPCPRRSAGSGRAASCGSSLLRWRTRGWWPRRSRRPPARGRRAATRPRGRRGRAARQAHAARARQLRAPRPAAADLGALLAACPGVTALVTSRHVLGLSAERTLPLAPLSTPAEDGGEARGQPGRRAVRRARPGAGPELRAHARQQRVGGGDLPAPGRAAAGDRARGCSRGRAAPPAMLARWDAAVGLDTSARATCRRASGRCAARSTGATTCSRCRSRPCCVGWRRSPAASTSTRWRRPSAATAACSGRWSSTRSPPSPPSSIAACCIARPARRPSRGSRCS